jgi:hypothetical protein
VERITMASMHPTHKETRLINTNELLDDLQKNKEKGAVE